MEDVEVKAVEQFSFSDARVYCQRVLGVYRIEHESDALNELIVLLEHSTLAITLACSYIKQNSDVTIAQYATLFKEKLPLLERRNFTGSAVIATAWGLNWEKMKSGFDDPIFLICACSLLHHENIPLELLYGLSESHDNFTAAVRVVSDYSLFFLNETDSTISIPAVFQEIFVEGFPQENTQGVRNEVFDHIVEFWVTRVKESYEVRYKNILLLSLKKMLSGFEALEEKKQGKAKKSCRIRMLVCMEMLRDFYSHLNDIEELLMVCQKTCVLYAQLNDPTLEIYYLNALYGLMRVYEAIQNHVELAEVCRKVLAVPRIDDATRVNALARLGSLLFERGEMQEGLGFLEQAKAIEEEKLHRPAERLHICGALGEGYLRASNFEEARKNYESAVMLEREQGGNSPQLAMLLTDLSTVHSRLVNYVEAEKFATEALVIKERVFGPDDMEVVFTLNSLGFARMGLANFSGACEVLQRAWKICEKNKTCASPLAGKIALNLGNCIAGNDQKLMWLQCALNIQTKIVGARHPDIAEIVYGIAVYHLRMGELGQSLKNVTRAYEMVLNFPGFGESHWLTQKIKFFLMIVRSTQSLFDIFAQRNENTDKVNSLLKEMAENFLRNKPDAAIECLNQLNAMCGYSLEGCENVIPSIVRNFEGDNGGARLLRAMVKKQEEDPARHAREDELCEKLLDKTYEEVQTEIKVYIHEGIDNYCKGEYSVAQFLFEEARELSDLFEASENILAVIHFYLDAIRRKEQENALGLRHLVAVHTPDASTARPPVEALHHEQLHYTVFQGSNTPKSKQFEAFLADILLFIKQQRRREEKIFFNYAWPKEKDDHNEKWHTQFILWVKRHLSQVGLAISLDQDDSIIAHNLNAFMQRIEQSDRVFSFGSKTRDEKLGWKKSGVAHENNLIVSFQAKKSVDRPFVVHVSLSDMCNVEPDSTTRKNIPFVTDYLLLLKWLIAEAYGFGEDFEGVWQEKLKAHKIMDALISVPAQAPNMVKRTKLLEALDQKLTESNGLVCVGDKKAGKKQVCLSYIWDNYYRFTAVYWGTFEEVSRFTIKPNALVVLLEPHHVSELQALLKRKDIKIIIISSEYLLLDECEYLRVGELSPVEAQALIKNIIVDSLVSERESLMRLVGLLPEPLLRACGYIQRNRMTISEYLVDAIQSRTEISRFNLKPIRERRIAASANAEEDTVVNIKRRKKAPEFKSDSSSGTLNISEPPPEDPQKVKLRCEELQRFRQSEGHDAFLAEVKHEIAKLQLKPKTVFISFAVPPAAQLEDAWTTAFVQGIADSFLQLGVEVYFLDSTVDLVRYVDQNRSRIEDIHVFIVSTPARLKAADIIQQDDMIKKCQRQFGELLKPDQVFVMPIRLTSKKYYDTHYENYAAYSFYEQDYMTQLRDLVAFMFGLDGESVEQFWRENALRYRLESNWWPSRPAEHRDFVGRKKALTDMQQHFRTSQKLLVIAATGMGGVGKTYLARQFALLYAHKYSEVFWLTGGSREALFQQYVALGKDKGLLTSEDEKKYSLKDCVQIVINWMQNKRTGWLLVIDGTTREEIEGCIPSQGGKVLATSRHTEWEGPCNISLDVFTEAEAREYFETVLGREIVERESEAIDDLIVLLGCLPLAIAIACAYIKQNAPRTIAEYLANYKKAMKMDGKHVALRATWCVTLDQLQKEYFPALELLYLSTTLHHENIPVYLIQAFFKNKIIADNALRVAAEYSLVTINEVDKTFSFHAFVHDVLREELAEAVAQRWQKNAIETMRVCFPDSNQLQAIFMRRTLLPHLKKLLAHVESHSETNPWTVDGGYQEHCHFLMTLIASVVMSNDVISLQASEELLSVGQKMLVISQQDSSLEAKRRSRVALLCIGKAYDRLGKPLEVIEVICERALPLCEPSDCVDQVHMFCMVAGAYFDLGRHTDQLHWLEKAKDIAEKNPDQSCDRGKIYHGLCIACGALGKYGEALKYAEQGFHFIRAFVEAGHPQMAHAHRALGECYIALGNDEAARRELEEARKIQEKVYGEEHLEVINILTLLGQVYFSLEHYDEAEKLLEKSLRIKEFALGLHHLEVANTLNILAVPRLRKLDIVGARALLKRAWNIYKASGRLGDRGAAKIAENMAQTFISPEDLPRRLKWLNRALKITIECYGENHPEVAEVLHNMAISYLLAGQYEKIRELKARILTIFASHPDFGEHNPKAQMLRTRLETMEAWRNLYEASTKEDASGAEVKALLKAALQQCQNNNDSEARHILDQCFARCGVSPAQKKGVSDYISFMLNHLGGNDPHLGLLSLLHTLTRSEVMEKDVAIKMVKALPPFVFERNDFGVSREEAVASIQDAPSLVEEITQLVREATENAQQGEFLIGSLLNEEALEQCELLSESASREKLEGMICFSLGIFCSDAYEHHEVLKYLERALTIYERFDDMQEEIPFIRKKIRWVLDEIERSERRVLDEIEKSQMPAENGTVEETLGSIFRSDEYRETLEHYIDEMGLGGNVEEIMSSQEFNNKAHENLAARMKEKYLGFMREATDHFEQGEYLIARVLFEEVLELCNAFAEHEGSVADIHYNLGLICWKEKDYTEAREYFTRALSAYQQLKAETQVQETQLCLWKVQREAEQSQTSDQWSWSDAFSLWKDVIVVGAAVSLAYKVVAQYF